MNLKRKALSLVIFLPLLPAIGRGQSGITINGFEGPESAPLYVIEGSFSQTYSVDDLTFQLDWSMAMNPNTGALGGTGIFSVEGYFPYAGISYPISLRGSVGVALKTLQAGDVVRVNGNLNIKGRGSIAGMRVQRFNVTYSFRNFEIDPSGGTMTGTLSAKGSAQVRGKNFPVNVPAQTIDFQLPDGDEFPGWDSAGDWTMWVQAAADRKGKIKGGGQLTVFDQGGEPYDVIFQKISGSTRNGIVSLQAVGRKSATSRVRFSLAYPQSDDPDHSYLGGSVSAYGQSRGF